MRTRARTALVAFLVVAAACSHATSAKPITFGTATASPPVVKVGTSFTVTPAGVVDRECAAMARVYKAVEGMPPYLQLSPQGRAIPINATQATWLPCIVAPNDKPVTYQLGDDFPIGSFVLCLGPDTQPSACVTFRTTGA
jgi:hypothetical protein